MSGCTGRAFIGKSWAKEDMERVYQTRPGLADELVDEVEEDYEEDLEMEVNLDGSGYGRRISYEGSEDVPF